MNIGDIIGGCRILCECGTGAYGTVYLAKDAFDRTVAVKYFHEKWGNTHKLDGLRRYTACGNVNEGLVKIFHFGVENDHLFYVMEAADNASPGNGYVPDTLALRLARNGKMSLDGALHICRNMLDALETLHGLGMVHRDLKPDNVIFVNGRPKLSDLDFVSDYSRTMSLVGTFGFIPPEYLNCEEVPKTPGMDLYALGMIFYCSITGNTPAAYPKLPEDMREDELYSVCRPLARMCSRDSGKRPENCAAFRELLPDGTEHFYGMRRFIYSLALSKSKRIKFAALCMALIAGVVLAIYSGNAIISGIAERHARLVDSKKKEIAELQRRLPFMANMLGKELFSKIKKKLEHASTLDKWDEYRELSGSLFYVQNAIENVAKEKMPELINLSNIKGNSLLTPENVLKNGKSFGFLHSVLARTALKNDEWRELRTKIHKEAEYIYSGSLLAPGRVFNTEQHVMGNYVFVPPFKGKVEYPFWIMSDNLSTENFVIASGYSRMEGRHFKDCVTNICKNDILTACKGIYDYLKSNYQLPPGYIVRPPTPEELELYLEYAAMGEDGYIVADGKAKLPWPAVVTMRRDDPENMLVYPRDSWKNYVVEPDDMANSPAHTMRPALAPGDESFYEKAWKTKHKILDGEYDGRFYAGATTCYAFASYNAMRYIADLFNADIVEPDSPEDWAEINKKFNSRPAFPAVLGFKFRDGEWRRSSDDSAIGWKNLPQGSDKNPYLMVNNGKLFATIGTFTAPCMILQWNSRERWESRADALKNGTSPFIERKIRVGDRLFYLIKFPVSAYAADSICRYSGLKLAVLKDPDVREKVCSQLKDIEKPIVVGAVRYYFDNWRWSDGTLEPYSASHNSFNRDPRFSPAFEVFGIRAGKMTGIFDARYALLEM